MWSSIALPIRRAGSAFPLGAALLASAACASRTTEIESPGAVVTTPQPLPAVRSAQAVTATWPMKPREAASTVIAKYGQPDVIGDRVLIWYDKGPYKKIVLMREEQPHSFPMPHTDFLTQTVMYRVPFDKVDEVTAYDGSVWFHRTRGELSAQCDVEEMNNLALNLAHDVATGARTVEDARAFYAKTAMEFKQGNRSSPYVTGLRFQPDRGAADPDKVHHQM
jgi:hypothetical protein